MRLLFLILFLALNQASESQWFLDANFQGFYVGALSVIDTSTVWGLGGSDFLGDTPFVARRTIQDGWRLMPTNGLPFERVYNTIAGVDSMTAFVGTIYGKVFRTTNAGQNWVMQIDVGGEGYINLIRFSHINKSYGYIHSDPPGGPGTPFKMFKTSNYGANWTEYSPLLGGSSYLGLDGSGCVTDSNHAWFGLICVPPGPCTGAKIGLTTNGGLN